MIFQINLLTAVMNDAPVLPDEDDEVERYKSIYAIHQYVMLTDKYICKIQSLHLQICELDQMTESLHRMRSPCSQTVLNASASASL